MLKTIQKRMTVVLIVSMLLQLFASVTPVLAEDSGDLIAEPEFVPMLSATLSPGETTGATSATVVDYVYGNLLVNVTKQEIETPRVGDVAPTSGDNMIADYEPGADITAGVAAGNYLQIYDVDMEEGARIFAFYQVELTVDDIKEEISEGIKKESGDSEAIEAALMAEGGYTYIDENGVMRNTAGKTVTKLTSIPAYFNEGWYIAEGSMRKPASTYVNGNVHLILADNSSLTAIGNSTDAGINVTEGNSLTIYAQSNGSEIGSLSCQGGQYGPGIGAAYEKNCGTIIINGGMITANGGYRGAGIGGGYNKYGPWDAGKGGNVTINNGIVHAMGREGGAGIGGGYGGDGGEVTINGGTITAESRGSGAGIGGGIYGEGGKVTINNGTVIAFGEAIGRGAGIGGGGDNGGGTVTLNGGIVIATGGGWGGAGIGSGESFDGGNVIIKNESVTVIATGGEGAADIGNGKGGTRQFNIKRGDLAGTDLTYVKLQVQNLPKDSVEKIYFNGQEHEINSAAITGFFVDKSAQTKNISLDPAGPLININPGDVQNSRITIDARPYGALVTGFGQALGFNPGLKSRISVPTSGPSWNTKIQGDSFFTVSMWIYPKENEPYQTLFRQKEDGASTLGLDFKFIKYNDDEGYLYFRFNKEDFGWQNSFSLDDEALLAAIPKIPTNCWTHVALVKSVTSVILYVNGEKYYEMTLGDLYYNSPAPLNCDISFGGTPSEDQFFSGRMDEIQFWKTALTPAEIKAWMYREIDSTHKKYKNLVYYYKLNQESGTTVIDSKGLNNGTAVNVTNSDWVPSDVRDWTVNAGETLNGQLAGSYLGGSSSDGTDWKLSFEIVRQAQKGTATITNDNQFEYRTHDLNQLGHDSFTYRVKNPDGKYSSDGTVNINILPNIKTFIYIDENDEIKNTAGKTVSVITPDTTTISEGWYIAEGIINKSGTIDVNGNVHLILADNSSLTVTGRNGAGINVSEGNSLTIYSQSKGDNVGLLNVTGHTSAAGIGGNNENSGSITINGGKITAIGGSDGAGIGGGSTGSGGVIIISGGTVTATGGNRGAGIGGGYKGNGGTIIIKNHPTVVSTGKGDAADIGSGANGSGITVIKNAADEEADLTYVRLTVRASSPHKAKKTTFNGGEYDINNEGLTGFFIKKSSESLNIGLEPMGVVININPGDVQNSRITLKDADFALPAVGFDHALNFSANLQSRIIVPFENAIKIDGNSWFTISMWICPNGNEPYQTLYRQYNDSSKLDLQVWLRYIKSGDKEGYLYLGFDKSLDGWQWPWDWNDGIPPSYIPKIPVDQWTHVALTKFGDNIILYVNGEKYYEMYLDGRLTNANKPYRGSISFGGSPFGSPSEGQFFSGKMDEIQFWNTPLTLDEIKAWMYREIDNRHPKYGNLVYYYKLNQISGTTAIDSKGSYNGNIVNITDANWVASDVREWTVNAGDTLTGQLVGSYIGGSSSNGLDWNLGFEIVEQAKKGTATIISDNKFEYQTNDMSQEGHDSFTYRVKGSDGKYSNIETVNLNIIPKTTQYWPPISNDSDRYEKPADTGVEILVNGKPETLATETTTQEGDKSITTVVVDDQKVEKILEQEGNHAVVTIPVMSGADVVIGTLNGQTVKNMESKDAVLEIKTGQVTYTLPASQINIDAVSGQFGKQMELKDIAVSVKISEPAADTVKIVEETADKNNYQIIVKPIEFEITCSSGSKTVEISKFNAYIERIIAIPEGVDPSKITTGVILNSDGTFSHVPTVITMIDGKYYAKINSLTNSVYSVIYSPKTFKDVKNHWAEKDVNDMASRLVISGVGNDLFEPERSITRAEFSTVMVRALGLRPEEYKNNLFDVKAGEWYSEYISTLSYYGLVRGYDDGTFKPDGNITRQEAMAILARAMDTTKLGEELEIDASHILAVFNDNADVSGWAKDSVSKCVKAGVVTGRDNSRIAPLDNITRAETTIMVRRLLLNSGLINA